MKSLGELAEQRMKALHLASVSEAAHVVFIAGQVIVDLVATLETPPDCTFSEGTLKVRVPHGGLAHVIFGMKVAVIRETNIRLRKNLVKKIRIQIGAPLTKERDWDAYGM